MKLKITRTEKRIKKTGLITADDIRKKFRLPDNAEIYVTIPYEMYSGQSLSLDKKDGDVEGIAVEVEEITTS
jgi:hypothetical protein